MGSPSAAFSINQDVLGRTPHYTITRNREQDSTFSFRQRASVDDQVIEISGYTAIMEIRSSKFGPEIAQLSGSINREDSSRADFEIPIEFMQNLAISTRVACYHYIIKLTAPDGVQNVPLQGIFRIQ